MTDNKRFKIATFAGGCFWCMVQPFERLDGVHEVLTGYMGVYRESPTYAQALRFIPVEDLEREGYGEYLALFKQE